MSVVAKPKKKKVSIHCLQRKKNDGEKIVSLTAYDYTTAKILDESGDIDFVLVGDSLAMTVLGHKDTLSVTVDEMIHHVRAVSRGTNRSLVVADMPFMSYHADFSESVKNAGRFVQEGHATAVKIEGARPHIIKLVEHLSNIGIPVMGHLGFTPQSINTMGGYRVQGKTIDNAIEILKGAMALERAGAFAVVLEMVPVELARFITKSIGIPTIGIGSGHDCDGQILVVDDVLGRYNDISPRFVRRYMDSQIQITQAINGYASDIATRTFPDNETESFAFPPELSHELQEALLEALNNADRL